jgi:hypothetical protein
MRNFFATGLPLASTQHDHSSSPRITGESLVSSPFVSKKVLAGLRLLLGLYSLLVIIIELALIGIDQDNR